MTSSTFVKGFICALCGPIPKANKKTVNKRPYNICPTCMKFVEVWERPEKERAGRCFNCGGGGFTLAIVNSHLIRKCKQCGECYDTDAAKVIRKGEKVDEHSKNNGIN